MQRGEVAILMVADDVLFTSEAARNPPKAALHSRNGWQEERVTTWSVNKCSYLRKGSGGNRLNLCVQQLKERDTEVYLGVTLHATGLQAAKLNERARHGWKDLNILVGLSWWSAFLKPSQIEFMFNMYVPSIFRYGLVVVGTGEEIRALDQKWKEMAMKALLNTSAPIVGRGKMKLEALLQISNLEWLMEREPGRTVRNWQVYAEEYYGGKRA